MPSAAILHVHVIGVGTLDLHQPRAEDPFGACAHGLAAVQVALVRLAVEAGDWEDERLAKLGPHGQPAKLGPKELGLAAVLGRLSPWNRALFDYLPEVIQGELLLSREIHGTLQLSQIETEKMMMELVGRELARRKSRGEYTGTYKTMTHFFGYQTRCGFPSEFDCSLGETLGRLSVSLVAHSCTGYLASCRNQLLCAPLRRPEATTAVVSRPTNLLFGRPALF